MKIIKTLKLNGYDWLAELFQVKILVKHFIKRFIQKDNLDLDDRNTESFVFGVAFISMWGGYLADHNDILFFLCIMMTSSAIFGVLHWESLMLDQRDFLNLLSLPVRQRTIIISKFFSIISMIGVITASFCFISSIVYTLQFATAIDCHYLCFSNIFLHGKTGTDALIFGMIFFGVAFLANLFVFLLLLAVQSFLMMVLRGVWVERISLWIQVLLLTVLASVFIWVPRLYDNDNTLQHVSTGFSYLFPPLWFNGLIQTLNGTFSGLSWYYQFITWAALIFLIGVYLFSLPWSLKQFIKPNPMKKGIHSTILYWILKPIKMAFNTLFLRDLTERAVFYFFARVIKRSRFHRLKLAMFLALPVGVIIATLWLQYRDSGIQAWRQISTFQLSIPFLIYCCTILGLRIVMDYPMTLEANWIFKVTHAAENTRYFRGIKKAMFCFVILPIAVVMFSFFLYSWGLRAAVIYSVYSLLVAMMIQELFFFKYQKIPFTAVYNPKVNDFKASWPLFALKFLFGYLFYLSIGNLLLQSFEANLWFYLMAGVILTGFSFYRYKMRYHRLVFEDLPPATMVSLDLYY